MFTANLNTVKSQTAKRVMLSGLCGGESTAEVEAAVSDRVNGCSKARKVKDAFARFKQRVKDKPNTLFLIIVDECHYACLKGQPHDQYVNDPLLLCSENVVVVCISATPYPLLTRDSRVPERYQSQDGSKDLLVHTNSDGKCEVFKYDSNENLIPASDNSVPAGLNQVNLLSYAPQ